MKKMFIFSDCIATFSPHGSGTPMHLRPLRLIYDEYHQKYDDDDDDDVCDDVDKHGNIFDDDDDNGKIW